MLNFILNHIEQINFTIITKLIFPPILIYQMFTMFNIYLQYLTQTNYNFIPYNISDKKYSVNEFPAITACNDLLFDKIWFEDYYDPDLVDLKLLRLNLEKQAIFFEPRIIKECENSQSLISYINKHIDNEHVKFSLFKIILANFLQPYKGFDYTFRYRLVKILNSLRDLIANDHDDFHQRMLRFEDKHSNGLNSTKQLFDFFGEHYSCTINDPYNPSNDCSLFGQILSLLSPLGKCHTFLYNNDINQTHVKSIKILMNSYPSGKFSHLLYPNYLNFRILLHPKYSIPDHGSIEIIPFYNYMFQSYNMEIELKKTIIKRMEKPYDTECHDYGESNQIFCLNSCLTKKYQDAFNCLPSSNNYHTIILENITKNNVGNLFCPNYLNENITKFEIKLKYLCNQMCGTSCHEVLHDVEINLRKPSFMTLIIDFYPTETTYEYIEYVPKLPIMEFLIDLFNIWNLWHGTSLITILVMLSNFSKKILRFILQAYFKVPFTTNHLNTKKLIKFISSILLLLFTAKIISLTMDYLRFDTITKINLLNYEDDANYPYLTFTLGQYKDPFMVNLANFKFNFTMVPKDEFSENDSLSKIEKLEIDYEEFQTYSPFYSTADEIEFSFLRLNISNQDLFDEKYFRNYCLSDIWLNNLDDSLSAINIMEQNLSYSSIFV